MSRLPTPGQVVLALLLAAAVLALTRRLWS